MLPVSLISALPPPTESIDASCRRVSRTSAETKRDGRHRRWHLKHVSQEDRCSISHGALEIDRMAGCLLFCLRS